MKALLLIVSLFAWPIIGIQFGCLRNATLSALSTATWLYNVTGCDVCACYTVRSSAVAYNCYILGNNNIRCLIFQNYSDVSNGVEVLSGQNQSFTCFTLLPPQYKPTSGMHFREESQLVAFVELTFHPFSVYVAARSLCIE